MLRKFYVVLTDTRSVLTRLIKLYTKDPYNHASIALEADLTEMYSFGRKIPYVPFLGGFVIEGFNSGTFRRFKDTRCMVLCFDVDHDQYQQMKLHIDRFVENQDVYHYNFIGLLGMLFNQRISRDNGYYCSEFVAEVVEHTHVYQWDKAPYEVRPFDFARLQGYEVVFEGKLSEYAHHMKETGYGEHIIQSTRS